MESNPKISVIVPVYKAEKYIHRCIDSLLAQTFKNFELLLIDDGSPDSSGKICDEYASIDSRVRVFHKGNGGVSSARQYGLEHAVGDYVIHADPDDWVESEMLQELYNKAISENADMVICDYYLFDLSTNRKTYVKVSPPLNSEELLAKIISGEVHASLWNKLIKRTLFFGNKIAFIEGLNMYEDLSVMFRLVYFANKIAYVPEPLYYYVIGRSGSYTSQKMSLSQQKNITDLIVLFDEFFKDKNIEGEIFKEVRYFKAGTLCKIALYGNLEYYEQTKTIYEDIELKDILMQPTIGAKLKPFGMLSYFNMKSILIVFSTIICRLK